MYLNKPKNELIFNKYSIFQSIDYVGGYVNH